MKTKFIAEMVGTMVLVLMGCGAAVLNGGATSVAAVLTIAFAFGLSVVAMAYTIDPVSGCHINPAITIGVWLNGGLSVMEAGVYISDGRNTWLCIAVVDYRHNGDRRYGSQRF